MLGAQLAALHDGALPGVDEALDLIAGFDDALVSGFARLGEERAAALVALAGALGGTPLGPSAAEAAGKVTVGSITDEHLTTLAGARTALFGAVHDALLARLDDALGRSRADWEGTQPQSGDPLAGACRSWLAELAITGWRGVDHGLASSADQAIQNLLAEPRLRRPAMLLDGLAAELRASSPVGAMERLPARRWADLWARGLLLTRTGGLEATELVSGRLLPLGVDVHEHGTAVQIQIHAILEPHGRLVRTSVAAAKVDTIAGPFVWQLLSSYPVLLDALARRLSLEVTDMPLLPSGDLLWHEGRASAGAYTDPFATARVQLTGAVSPAVPPLERHPVRIAEPVFVEGYKSDGKTLQLDGSGLAFDLDRLPQSGPLTPQLLKASTACIGLMRWDGGQWRLQPLAVQATVKKERLAVHNGDWALGPTDQKARGSGAKAGDPVAVLKERAGRLLRR
ncbi:hypothetical protein GCM10023194_58240 [Planotetraspora phitsanulokensis]|uniref:Uncharacterized protein n=1 Tax=Planotetraspora phitsanulokensis TaxID=575192 RepID=A0A8J3UAY0_9ACTN|nr:hypothetical protein [Planotetraspora phitsanulokensis]GII40287.1 hypothetical protein Pph01_52900 [Planotetraspora phitsanulokensis]